MSIEHLPFWRPIASCVGVATATDTFICNTLMKLHNLPCQWPHWCSKCLSSFWLQFCAHGIIQRDMSIKNCKGCEVVRVIFSACVCVFPIPSMYGLFTYIWLIFVGFHVGLNIPVPWILWVNTCDLRSRTVHSIRSKCCWPTPKIGLASSTIQLWRTSGKKWQHFYGKSNGGTENNHAIV